MARVGVRKEPDGWRLYAVDGHKTIVWNDFFEYEDEAQDAAKALTRAGGI